VAESSNPAAAPFAFEDSLLLAAVTLAINLRKIDFQAIGEDFLG